MAADQGLIERIRAVIGDRPEVNEKHMFGGVAFMLNGNMACGPTDERLMVRLGKEGAAAALSEPHVTPMDFTGRPLSTMIYVLPEGIDDDGDLRAWVERGLAFAASLPPK